MVRVPKPKIIGLMNVIVCHSFKLFVCASLSMLNNSRADLIYKN